MTNENLAFAAAPIAAAVAADRPARVYLDEMMARAGVDGLAAAFAEPALLARLDQHAAAVRDALRAAGRATDAEGLAAYARSIAAGAVRMGRPLPEPGFAPVTATEWLAAGFPLLRVVAICMIAEAGGLL
ncbi:hypothetical protein FHR83_002671 [Actinoplanes campanulatus]|uniref:Uncharacterized protein n=1 Tax=Actinoplanes campanulatus TaxID=113559 RepID=A0A7W5AET7_9ACTN|nr:MULTISPECIES: DUF6401 family natural product biosynthesis protein [Actinoplanes]MBB3095008.1 hypothetical protein [Actinoplanes campanulatus]GGN08916.1 hypothetical protein GCM10010109_17960 [Actinoplanes campanulatus]GID36303.1 hypothetical protein Aca09nite_28090 [Actinoplanes campanulatus]GID50630.1 hypothetical protein Aca07nite_79050 [Actinoplanes capillaceus]